MQSLITLGDLENHPGYFFNITMRSLKCHQDSSLFRVDFDMFHCIKATIETKNLLTCHNTFSSYIIHILLRYIWFQNFVKHEYFPLKKKNLINHEWLENNWRCKSDQHVWYTLLKECSSIHTHFTYMYIMIWAEIFGQAKVKSFFW